MGIIRKTLVAGTVTAAATLGYIGSATTLTRPLPVNDSVFKSKLYKKHNIHRNPPTQDVVTKRVPLDKIRPELLEKEGDIVLEFCRGVWTSPGTCANPQKQISSPLGSLVNDSPPDYIFF